MADTAFNGRAIDFLQTLQQAFPQNGRIPVALEGLIHLAESNDPDTRSLPRRTFAEEIRPHLDALRARDTQYMSEHMDEVGFIRELGIREYWVHKDMPEPTRKIIWDKLSLMVTLATALDAVDPKLLPMLEQIAKQAIEDGDFRPGQMPDMNSIMSKVMGIMGGQLGGKE